jgi:hypothetical protein
MLRRRTSKVTLRVLNEYKAEVDSTAQQLQGHFEELRGRLDGLTTPAPELASAPSTHLEQILKETSSIQDCLQICHRFQADLNQMQFQLAQSGQSPNPASLPTASATEDMTLAKTITLSGLKACGLEISDTVSKLTLQEVKARERIREESSTNIQHPTKTQLEVQRLQRELDSVNELLNVCKNASSRATPDRVHIIENIVAGDNSQQIFASTVGDLFKVIGATTGDGSFQFIGSIPTEPLQQIVKMHNERQPNNDGDAGAVVHSGSSNRGSPAS